MKRTVKAAAVSAALAFAFAGAIGVSGCSNADYTMGAQSQTATAVSLTNDMGKSIIGVAVKESSDESYGDTMEPKDSMLADANTTVYFELADPSKKYDVKVDCDDGSLYELHKIKIADVQDAVFKVEGQVGYIVYTSKATGKEVNTLKKEKALVEGKKLAKEKAAAKKKAAQDKAKKKAADAAEKNAAEQNAAQEQPNSQSSANNSPRSSSKSNTGSNGGRSNSSKGDTPSKKKDTAGKKGDTPSKKPEPSAKTNTGSGGGEKPSPTKDEPSCTDDILLK